MPEGPPPAPGMESILFYIRELEDVLNEIYSQYKDMSDDRIEESWAKKARAILDKTRYGSGE